MLDLVTVNIGTIKGGDKVNIVADLCEFSVDIRFMPGMDPQKIIARVKKIASSVTRDFEFMIDDLQMPYGIDEKNKYVKTYIKAVEKVGKKAVLKGSNGATVISFFQHQNIPAFATGFGKSGTLHTNDEYAEIPTLYHGARALEQFVRDYDAL